MTPEEVPAELAEKARAGVPLLRLGMSTEEIARSVLAAVLPTIRAQAWSAGFDAATDAAPLDVWLPAWDDIDNPYRTSEEPTA